MRRQRWTQMIPTANTLMGGIPCQLGHLRGQNQPNQKEVTMADVFSFKNGVAPQASDFVFQFGVPTNIVAGVNDGNRRFSGVAYTGDPITNHPYWGTVVFDLSLIEVPAKMAILRDHECEDIVGFSDESAVTQDGLVLGGVLSKVTDAGKEVAALSDEGFPWQMSVRIQPSRIEELSAGATAVINNRTVTGPAYIFRESKLVETSFTPTGWDSGTTATALSHSLNPTSQEDSVSKELEAKVAQLEGELSASKTNNDALKKELDELKASISTKEADARMSRVKDAYKAVGKELSEEEAKKFANMPDDAVNAVVDALAVVKPNLPEGLFSHQATDGVAPVAKPHEKGLLAACDAAAAEFSKSRK